VLALLVRWVRPRLGRHPGAVFFAYIGLYSVGRFFIEGLRLDSFWIGPLRVGQLASAVGVLVAAAGIRWALRRAPIDAPPAAAPGPTGTGRARRGRRPPG
jgi:phosphatidylglycerol:prolipoprotein diacylglycerol transferase